jgi:hypothetical protein
MGDAGVAHPDCTWGLAFLKKAAKGIFSKTRGPLT